MEKLSGNRKDLKLIIIAFLIGAFWIMAVRFVLYSPNNVHYHANFAVFVEGQRLPFESPLYYEEVQSCGGEDVNNPKIRVHMHGQESDVVHVHDDASTWGHFFANLGMTNGDILFRYDDVIYVDDADTNIRFYLNGKEVSTTANRTINSEDTLLVSIGDPSDQDLEVQYNQIAQDAGEHNDKADPSSCSGSKDATFTERLKASIGILD